MSKQPSHQWGGDQPNQNPYYAGAANEGGAQYAPNPAYGYAIGNGGTNASHLNGGSPPHPGKTYSGDGYSNGAQNTSAAEAAAYGQPQGGGGGAMQGIPLYEEGCDARAKKFVVQGYKDVWAAILFVLCTLSCIVLGCYNFGTSFGDVTSVGGNYSKVDESTGLYETDEDVPHVSRAVGLSAGALVGLLIAMVALAALFASLSFFLFYKFPKQAIIGANVASILLMLVSSIFAFMMGSVFAGVITLIFAIINAAILYAFRHRIDFSAILLRSCSGIAITYKGLIVSNYGIVGIFSIFTMFWSSAMYPSVYRINENNGTATGGDAGILLFCVFCYFWVSQVAFNVMHVTASGVTATWYFVGGDAYMPRNPTVASLRRAVTTSFGSICFGSLIVAILKLLRFIARQSRGNSENDFVRCILECIIHCIERLVEYFNHFAFVYCAIYGYDYITAAKKTFALASNCAFAATFNESLVNTTLTIVSIAASALALIIFWAASNIAIGLVAFCITLFVHIQLFRIIDSGTTTMFVCFAEEPNTLATVNSELYERLYASNAGAGGVSV